MHHETALSVIHMSSPYVFETPRILKQFHKNLYPVVHKVSSHTIEPSYKEHTVNHLLVTKAPPSDRPHSILTMKVDPTVIPHK